MSPLWQFAEAVLVPAMLVLSMLGMGLALRTRDFSGLGRGRGAIWVGLVMQLLWPPAVASLFVVGLDLSPGWAMGLLLISVVPGGAVSSLFTHLARGNAALSIALTLAGTLLSIVSIPLVLGLIASDYMSATFSIPAGAIAADIGLFLLAPLLLGMVLHRLAPVASPTLSKGCVRASIVLLLSIVALSLVSGRISILQYGLVPPMVLIVFMAALMATAEVAGRILLRNNRDAVALAMSMGIRNGALALLLTQFFFAGSEAQGHVIYSCLFYAGVSFLAAVPIILRERVAPRFARGKAPAPASDAAHVPAPSAVLTQVSGGARRDGLLRPSPR